MIEFKTGDLFAEDGLALAHGVNCAGAMGAGIADVRSVLVDVAGDSKVELTVFSLELS